MSARTLPPAVHAAGWLVAQQVVARVVGCRRPGLVVRSVGVALVGTAAAVGVDALARFVRRGTTWEPWSPEQASALVTEGPNAFTRNPMYLAMAVGLVGTGLLSGVPWTAAAAQGLMTTLTPQVRREEDALADRFGAEWEAYRSRVPRWLSPGT